ncbi:MAG: flagellar hook-basal body complex protein, partial [Lachnospiraceae bacterium]|nr:flagellar hook-basal body complex protein [Lachnospiraceae bacterium]
FIVAEPGNVTQIPIQNGGNAIAQANVIGTIGLVDFENYDYLEKYGENLYDAIPGYRAIAATGSINQGYLEASNVNVVTEMVDMITIQRAYEAGQKVIQTMDSTLGIAATQVGKV